MIRGLAPLTRLMWIIGRRESRDRSRASSVKASETLNPVRHWTRNRRAAREFGAARISASTSWASTYSGSVFGLRSVSW